MKYVFQTRFGGSGAPREQQGNCFQASVATLFQIPLEEAFDAVPYPDDQWLSEFNKWLAPHGLACIFLEVSPERPIACSKLEGYAFMQSKTQSGIEHVVVIKDGRLVHDPNPYGLNLGECEGLYLFVLLEPYKYF